jgi:hypothetical protein
MSKIKQLFKKTWFLISFAVGLLILLIVLASSWLYIKSLELSFTTPISSPATANINQSFQNNDFKITIHSVKEAKIGETYSWAKKKDQTHIILDVTIENLTDKTLYTSYSGIDKYDMYLQSGPLKFSYDSYQLRYLENINSWEKIDGDIVAEDKLRGILGFKVVPNFENFSLIIKKSGINTDSTIQIDLGSIKNFPVESTIKLEPGFNTLKNTSLLKIGELSGVSSSANRPNDMEVTIESCKFVSEKPEDTRFNRKPIIPKPKLKAVICSVYLKNVADKSIPVRDRGYSKDEDGRNYPALSEYGSSGFEIKSINQDLLPGEIARGEIGYFKIPEEAKQVRVYWEFSYGNQVIFDVSK